MSSGDRHEYATMLWQRLADQITGPGPLNRQIRALPSGLDLDAAIAAARRASTDIRRHGPTAAAALFRDVYAHAPGDYGQALRHLAQLIPHKREPAPTSLGRRPHWRP